MPLPEPKVTCSTIDLALDELLHIENYMSFVQRTLESLRNSDKDLREWGHEWKDLAEGRKIEIEELRSNINDLKDELRDKALILRRIMMVNK